MKFCLVEDNIINPKRKFRFSGCDFLQKKIKIKKWDLGFELVDPYHIRKLGEKEKRD